MLHRTTALLLFVYLLVPMSCLGTPPDYLARPGTALHALSAADGTRVTLDSMFVDRADGCYLFLRDPWRGGATIPVYGCSDVRKWWTVEVSGTMSTISGYRVLIAQSIRVYTDSKMRPCPPYPKGLYAPWEWPYMADVPIGASLLSVPPPPPSSPPPEEPDQLVGVAGTIAWAKLQPDMTTVELPGAYQVPAKVVTAIFPADGVRPFFFYIQERDDSDYRPCGIKVVPEQAVNLVPGDLISVSGTVTTVNGECQVSCDQEDIAVLGWAQVPKPLGLTNLATAAGEFGLQPELLRGYLSWGVGLNAVGSRVRVWGGYLSTSLSDGHRNYWIDDGSCLAGDVAAGLRVTYWVPGDAPAIPNPSLVEGDQMVYATGILGVEPIGSNGVPVVRVPHVCIVHVSKVGDDSNDGSSWEYAKLTVQAGISAASAGCEVWVAEGTYVEAIDLKDGVGVYGGFAGTERLRGQRDPAENETILDGCAGTQTPINDNVVDAESGVTRSAVLDGFTITRSPWICGAAVLCDGSSPTISGNVITDNHTGIACVNSGCSPLIRNNTITDNENSGIMSSSGAAPIITRNVIEANAAVSYGAGIFCDSGSAQITHNTIRDNLLSLGYGGGVACIGTPAGLLIDSNLFQGNGIFFCMEGGGLWLRQCMDAQVTNNVFAGNHCCYQSNTGGGAICVSESTVTIANNTFVGNSSYDPEVGPVGYGGAVHIYGEDGEVTLANNIFLDNEAYEGSSVSVLGGGDVLLLKCIFFPGDASTHFGGSVDWFSGGNAFTDPELCGGQDHPYWLQDTSPARGFADVGYAPARDFDGRPRPGVNGTYDAGAFEDNPDCTE